MPGFFHACGEARGPTEIEQAKKKGLALSQALLRFDAVSSVCS
jgi:hypothetical protein